MTHEEMLDIMNIVLRDKGKSLTKEEYQSLAKKVNIEYFKTKYGFLRTGERSEVSQQITDSLSTFKTVVAAAAVNADGQYTLPADYFHVISIRSGTYDVDVLTEQEVGDRRNSLIVAPSATYPVCIFYETYVQFYPLVSTTVEFVYYKYPDDPVYAEKVENGIKVYDSASSTEFEWRKEHHGDLIRLMLLDLGMAINDQQLTQIVEQKRMEEN